MLARPERLCGWLSILASLLLLASSAVAQTADISDLQARAEAGDAEAQFNLAEAYRRGEEVTRDFAEAIKWYRKATEQGHARSANRLGGMYLRGEGVPKDRDEAVRWFKTARALENNLPEPIPQQADRT